MISLFLSLSLCGVCVCFVYLCVVAAFRSKLQYLLVDVLLLLVVLSIVVIVLFSTIVVVVDQQSLILL
jgi:hypothetical protein